MPQGAIIIFFAIMIVAMSAGIFIITTMTTYQDRALFFGKEQINTVVGDFFNIEQVYARGPGDKTVHYLYIYGRMREDSDPLYLNTTLLHVVGGANDAFYVYDAAINCSANPYGVFDAFSLANTTFTEKYGVQMLLQIEGDNASRDFLVGHDYAVFCFALPYELHEVESLHLSITPERGGKTVLDFAMPELLAGQWIEIYQKLI